MISVLSLCLISWIGYSARQEATDYWAWDPSVHLSRVLQHAGKLYLLEGEWLQHGGVVDFQRRGFPPANASDHPIVLVYRLEAMQWEERLQRHIQQDIDAFEAKGNHLWGIQLDFDAATEKLGAYAVLLQQVRAWLPPNYHLSITGLLDWGSQGRLDALNALQNVVSEVVFQTYQGRHPLKDCPQYLARLSKRAITVPFKVGLVEHGDYDPGTLAEVTRHPFYRGNVVFLLPN